MLDSFTTAWEFFAVASAIGVLLNEWNIRRSLHRRGIGAELRSEIDRMFANLTFPARERNESAVPDQA